MGSYEDGYANNMEPHIVDRSISIEDKKLFLNDDIKDAKRNIEILEKSIEECQSGIDAAECVIETATKWLNEFDE